ncbi:MAG: OmpH family outer membrane protein, partial [Candidatus Thioglobus sp.]|nr:OmpH family outer membrane protein [Candidatus Thioglobus sp.]
MRKKYLILSFLLFNVALGAQSLKIGYINIDYIVASSPQFSQANDRIINKFKPQENNLLSLSNNIQLLVDKFNKNKDNFSRSEIKTKINK